LRLKAVALPTWALSHPCLELYVTVLHCFSSVLSQGRFCNLFLSQFVSYLVGELIVFKLHWLYWVFIYIWINFSFVEVQQGIT